MMTAQQIVKRLKQACEGQPKFGIKPQTAFGKDFTQIYVNPDGHAELKVDMYEQYRALVTEISGKHGILNDEKSIIDDDTIYDWLYSYDNNLGQIQEDYPNLTMHEIQIIFTWNTLCQARACAPCQNNFVNTQTYTL